jgi:hypothetical protein
MSYEKILRRWHVSPTITGPTDGWTIQLPSGFAINSTFVGQFFDLGEPEDSTTHNQVAITQPNFLTWDSDRPGAGTAPPFPSTSITLTGAGTFIGAAGSTPFDLILSDENPVPETTSTAMLLGIPALGILLAARRKTSIPVR